MKGTAPKLIETESPARAKAFKTELALSKIPFTLSVRGYVFGTFYEFVIPRIYSEYAIKLWRRICISVPDKRVL